MSEDRFEPELVWSPYMPQVYTDETMCKHAPYREECHCCRYKRSIADDFNAQVESPADPTRFALYKARLKEEREAEIEFQRNSKVLETIDKPMTGVSRIEIRDNGAKWIYEDNGNVMVVQKARNHTGEHIQVVCPCGRDVKSCFWQENNEWICDVCSRQQHLKKAPIHVGKRIALNGDLNDQGTITEFHYMFDKPYYRVEWDSEYGDRETNVAEDMWHQLHFTEKE